MYQYVWDEETGGLLLTSEGSKFSKEPRPVYYRELDILGFDKYWDYPRDDSAPIMWAEANNYIYRGKTIAQTRGGSLYTVPELCVVEDTIKEKLEFVDISAMAKKNQAILNNLEQETIQKIFNTYTKYKEKVDIFYVAYSGGKDSIVALDLVQQTLPHDQFVVLFGDTQMEFPDTYATVDEAESRCREKGIQFIRARSELIPPESWEIFGPPSTTNRWCCSVHKTSPQVIGLRKFLCKDDFKGMAFTGVRADESVKRSEYDRISEGKKHNGQMSCHAILDWNSAEVYMYIYIHGLPLNEAYKKGIPRAGCLVCPNSSGKHEYLKRIWYKEDVEKYTDIIASTSGKTNYSAEDMRLFIESGYWKTRRSGRELNFGQDMFEVMPDADPPEIIVYADNVDWQKWAFTVGYYYQEGDDKFVFKYANKLYPIQIYHGKGYLSFRVLNYRRTTDDIRFFFLFKGMIIKALYCVRCGVCVAECKHNCIDMDQDVVISDGCTHCQSCYDIYECCLRYNSVRCKRTEGKKMTGMDRYFSFGAREEWLRIYCDYNGSAEFWESNGDGLVANKKKDAFRNFLLDAGLADFDKKAIGDKYEKCLPNAFTNVIKKLGASSETSWALILCNLAYTPTFNWYIKTYKFGNSYTPEIVKSMLSEVMENDLKGLGKRNVLDAFKVFMAKTPLGTKHIFADCDIEVKQSGLNEQITLKSFVRCPWADPIPEVILYSLYKFVEASGERYQFTLEELMDDTIEREGVSPTQIFGLDRDTMVRILNGLSVNYSEFISASFTLDLDTVNLVQGKTSMDVLQLF